MDQVTMTKTDMAWGLSFGFCSAGTGESLKNENNFFAVGAISKILRFQMFSYLNLYYIYKKYIFSGVIKAYLMKSLRPKSAEFFFMTLHDFTTRASCSSVNTIFPSLSISSETKLLDMQLFSVMKTVWSY